MLRRWNAGEAGVVHRPHQEIARAAGSVAGEDAAGAVGAVRRGRQANDQQTCARVAKTGHRLAPIDIVAVRGFLLNGDALTVRAQPRAALTGNDIALNGRERV